MGTGVIGAGRTWGRTWGRTCGVLTAWLHARASVWYKLPDRINGRYWDPSQVWRSVGI